MGDEYVLHYSVRACATGEVCSPHVLDVTALGPCGWESQIAQRKGRGCGWTVLLPFNLGTTRTGQVMSATRSLSLSLSFLLFCFVVVYLLQAAVCLPASVSVSLCVSV